MNSQNDKRHRPKYNVISANDLLIINEEVTNHAPFVRDMQLLHSAVRRPYLVLFGEAQFPSVLDKAAATLHSIAAHHIFSDGNKRTAARATRLFLEANGITPQWTDDEIAGFVLRVAQGDVTVEDIVVWLKNHTESDRDE